MNTDSGGPGNINWTPEYTVESKVEPVAIPEEVWVTDDGLQLLKYIVIGLAGFAAIDLLIMAVIFIYRGDLPDIFGTLATIALSALAGVIGGAYASRSSA